MTLDVTKNRALVTLVATAIATMVLVYWARAGSAGAEPRLGATANANIGPNETGSLTAGERVSVDLSDSQLAAVKVEPIHEREFPVEKEAVGSIDFNEEMSVQVFTPYQGRIISLFASVGDDVKKGQTLFTIDSPDLLQAESTLIAAAGVLELTTRISRVFASSIRPAQYRSAS
jgi:membrane fusion protein, heavy metal efflux system